MSSAPRSCHNETAVCEASVVASCKDVEMTDIFEYYEWPSGDVRAYARFAKWTRP